MAPPGATTSIENLVRNSYSTHHSVEADPWIHPFKEPVLHGNNLGKNCRLFPRDPPNLKQRKVTFLHNNLIKFLVCWLQIEKKLIKFFMDMYNLPQKVQQFLWKRMKLSQKTSIFSVDAKLVDFFPVIIAGLIYLKQMVCNYV